MAIAALPIDQRVIDIDSRRFASIEKALVELITNSDDSYNRLERENIASSGHIRIFYERRKKSALLSVSDQAEGMDLARIRAVLAYGGAHSLLAQGEAGGRGYFGRGMKQAIYGLGRGWIESVHNGRFARIDLFREDSGRYVYDDWDGDRPAESNDYGRLQLEEGQNGTRINILVDSPAVNIPRFPSLAATIADNIYLRDILDRRKVELIDQNAPQRANVPQTLRFVPPPSEVLIGPDQQEIFTYREKRYHFLLTLRKARDTNLRQKGDSRLSGLLILSGTAVLDCQFFRFENQLGTEYLFGSVICPALSEKLAEGQAIISDEREGLNLKDPFVAALAKAVSDAIAHAVQMEQLRLSHVERASTSRRTHHMLEQILQKMNHIAANDLGIKLPPGPNNLTGLVPAENSAILRFSTPFYGRKVGRIFRVTLLTAPARLQKNKLEFVYALPAELQITPQRKYMAVADLPADGRIEWQALGSAIGVRGTITASCGPYSASCELRIAATAAGKGYHHPAGRRAMFPETAADLFAGYELRNLRNDIERAVYSPEERLILINTEAPTVRLYVDGQGRFRDGARLLLAELFLSVIAEELARHFVDRTAQKGNARAYEEAKQNFIHRYGADIHQILMGS